MVVPLEIADVVELRADAGAEGPELAEVLRGARCVEQFPGRDLLVVHFEHLRADSGAFVVEDRTASVAREIEIDVVREVHDRRFVRLGEVGDLQGIGRRRNRIRLRRSARRGNSGRRPPTGAT